MMEYLLSITLDQRIAILIKIEELIVLDRHRINNLLLAVIVILK
jgi:hypothetical protein